MENIQTNLIGILAIGMSLSIVFLWLYVNHLSGELDQLRDRISELEDKLEEINPRLR